MPADESKKPETPTREPTERLFRPLSEKEQEWMRRNGEQMAENIRNHEIGKTR